MHNHNLDIKNNFLFKKLLDIRNVDSIILFFFSVDIILKCFINYTFNIFSM